MKNHNSNHFINNKELGIALSQNLQNNKQGDCPTLEEIATLVEGNCSARERDHIMKHLSACKECYDTFILSSDIKDKSLKKTPLPYRPLALAASVLLVILSLFILYKSGIISTKSVQPMEEAEEPEIRTTQPLVADYLRKKDESTVEHKKKGARAKTPAKREREKKKRIISGRDETKSFSVSKKSYDAEKLKPELPGTQRQLEVPYPRSKKLDSKAKKSGITTKTEPQQKITVPQKPETSKEQMNQTEIQQTEGSIQELNSQVKIERDKIPEVSTVVSFHKNGNKKLVNNYIQISGKRTLKEIVEYDDKGRILSLQNPNTSIEKKFGYFPNGNKKYRKEYKKGEPHGNWISWNQKGEIITNRIYKKGKLEKKIK